MNSAAEFHRRIRVSTAWEPTTYLLCRPGSARPIYLGPRMSWPQGCPPWVQTIRFPGFAVLPTWLLRSHLVVPRPKSAFPPLAPESCRLVDPGPKCVMMMMMTEEREEYWYVDVPGGTRQDWDLTLGRLCRSHEHHHAHYTRVFL